MPTPEVKKPPEPTSVVPKETSSNGTTLSPSSLPTSNNTSANPPEVKKDPKEPISVIPRELSDTTLPSSPPPEIKVKPPEVKKDPKEPVSVLSRELSDTTSSRSRQPQRVSRGAGALPPMQMGLLLILFSTVFSSLYNVAIKAIFQPSSLILGAFQVEQLISPTLGNSLLILMLRMMVVVPLMLVLAPMMHQRVWQDLHSLAESVRGNPSPTKANTRRVLILSVVSGCFLFLSQLLIYLAIGQVPTGMAIALFFIYPMISGLLSWFLFRDQPTLFRIGAIASIFVGELLMLSGFAQAGIGNNSSGSMSAIASGVSFAIYVILTRICAAKLHPVTFTLINFATMLCLCFIGLMLPLPTNSSLIVDPNRLLELILSAFILGVMTLASYVLNNVGISKVSATRAAIFGASVPILTVIFAGLIIQETLSIVQALGVLLITFGAAAFSLERIRAS
ncbi:MAG: EamA family transporter [Hassallia sp.]